MRLTGVRVAGKNGVGGLAGFSTGAISGSHATGKATGVSFVGGLVGSSWEAISGSYATGSATGNDAVGGLVGLGSRGAIIASYATGARDVGGLVGSGSINSITASYAIGRVTGDRDVGGLVGRGSDRLQEVVTGSYWDTQTTGQSSSAGGAGKTTRELQQPTGTSGIYTGRGAEYWDFGTSWQYPALKYDGMDVGAQRLYGSGGGAFLFGWFVRWAVSPRKGGSGLPRNDG